MQSINHCLKIRITVTEPPKYKTIEHHKKDAATLAMGEIKKYIHKESTETNRAGKKLIKFSVYVILFGSLQTLICPEIT